MRKRLQYAVLAGAMVLCVVIAGVFLAKQSGDRAEAAEVARRFSSESAQPMATAAPVAVTVIGDDLASPAQSGRPVTEWPVLLQRAIPEQRVVSLSTPGSGYTTRPLTSLFGGTFVARAQQVARSSQIVLIMGGTNDQRASRVALLRAASETISNAQQAAPDATIVVVGPPSFDQDPPSSLTAVRNALQEAATRGDARFIDPIAQGWFTSGTGYLATDDRSLTVKGEQTLALRIGDVLEPLL